MCRRYVGNLHPCVTTAALQEICAYFGRVEQVKLIKVGAKRDCREQAAATPEPILACIARHSPYFRHGLDPMQLLPSSSWRHGCLGAVVPPPPARPPPLQAGTDPALC